jgi:lipooligosaccharide transport system ATP-binding protein
MHKGKRIIEGPPKDLLDKYIEKYVLELLDVGAPADKFDRDLQNGVRIDRSQQTTLLFSNNLEYLQTLAGSMKSGNYYLRETNLEDVFLKATGRELDEAQ